MENKKDLTTYGMFFNARTENQPFWLKGKISIKVPQFVEWLNKVKNSQEYVNLDLKESKDGRLYIQLNDYQPKSFATETEKIASQNSEYFDISDIPL